VTDRLAELLNRHGVIWSAGKISIDAIDWAATHAAQVRSGLPDQEVIDNYASALKAGVDLGPLLAVPGPAGGWKLLGGIHRAMAHQRADLAEASAYIATDADPQTCLVLALEHNSTHGLPLSNEDRCRHAIELCDQYHYTRSQAARIVGVAPSALSAHQARLKGNNLARSLGMGHVWKRLGISTQGRLAAACFKRGGDALFMEAVMVADNLALTSLEIGDLIRAFAGAADENTAILAVTDYETHYKPPTGRERPQPQPKPPSRQSASAAVRLHQMALALFELDPAEVADRATDPGYTGDLVTRMAGHLRSIIRALNARQPRGTP
jgi:hypothetical protein